MGPYSKPLSENTGNFFCMTDTTEHYWLSLCWDASEPVIEAHMEVTHKQDGNVERITYMRNGDVLCYGRCAPVNTERYFELWGAVAKLCKTLVELFGEDWIAGAAIRGD